MAFGDGGARSVLVVDDEPITRLNLAMFFQDEGIEVYEAEDALEAIDTLSTHPSIQVMITDIQMSRSMDGLDLANAVHKLFPSVDLVIVSGVVRPNPTDLPHDALFLSKPFDPRYLLGELERTKL